MLRRVITENGMIEGIPAADPRITAYKGIPFAAPPVGPLRFHAPEPASNWEGILKAYQFAPISMQPTPGIDQEDIYTKEWSVDPDIPMSEDCLYLNVWTPAKRTDEKLPVFVWYFGGGWQVGSTAEMEFDGERFARRGIVFVSVNYRVNVFGFLAHPEITKENPEYPTNFGLLDQQFGTQWVKRNIAAFGGDPENITIGGQSAGGGSVLRQISCEKNKGLFQRAIVQSGVFIQPYAELFPKRSLVQAEQIGVDFFRFLGVNTLEEARSLETSYITKKWDEYGGFFTSINNWTPVEDGKFTTDDFLSLYKKGEIMSIPMLIGHTTDEFHAQPLVDSKERLVQLASELCGEDALLYLSLLGYPTASFDEMKKAADISMIEYAIRVIGEINERTKSEKKNYYYDFSAEIPGYDNPGTFHSVDLWFTFETLAKCWRPFTGKHYDLARQMCNYWSNFIKTGDPNGIDSTGEPLPKWRPYTAAQPNKMHFTDTAKPVVSEPDPLMALMVQKYFKK